MSAQENKKAKYAHSPERVSLSPESLARVNGWLGQLQSVLQGSKVTRTDVINWLIQQHSETLTGREQIQIRERHFNPSKALRWAAEKYDEAVSSGEAANFESFVRKVILFHAETATPSLRSRKKKPSEPGKGGISLKQQNEPNIDGAKRL